MLIFLLILAFVIAWVVLTYFVLWPKRKQFLATMGLDQVRVYELSGLARLKLWLRGAKVSLLAFFVSAGPIIQIVYDHAADVDWSQLKGTRPLDVVVFVFTSFVGPMAAAWLHQNGIANAAAADPKQG